MLLKNTFPKILILIGLLTTINLLGQNTSEQTLSNKYQFESQKFTFPLAGVFHISEVEKDFFPKLINLEAPHPGGNSYRDYLEKLKSEIPPPSEIITYNKTASIEGPELVQGFKANSTRGNPNDNDVAISNEGWLVSVMNSAIYMNNVYEGDSILTDTVVENGDTTIVMDTIALDTIVEISLSEFVESLGSYNDVYDPKVKYDPIEDRFVLMFLHGRDSDDSQIMIGFSQTNNPTKGWNLYEIPGSPLGAGTWSDFPMLALTEDDLFLTINLLLDNASWEIGFTETIVWQIDKATAYAGAESLTTKLWADVSLNDQPIRNAIPVQGGIGLAGPNLFLLSNRNFDAENDTIFLMEITGNTFDDDAEFSVEVLESPIAYGAPPNARQSPTRLLQTNDARVLGAYYENDLIHFVGMTNVPDVNVPGIFHGTITEPGSSNLLEANIISDTLDLGYPNLAFSGNFPEEDQFIMVFSFASPTVRPGHGAIFYYDGEYSDILRIKEGNKFIGPSSITALPQRWGDYTGIQTKYDELGNVWTSGSYGFDIGFTISGYLGSTWVGELRSPLQNVVGIDEVENTSRPSISTSNVYPNPVQDRVFIDFEMKESQKLKFQLSNIQGQIVQTLLHDQVKEGQNQFSFSVHSLEAGVYLLSILSPKSEVIVSKRIVVE